MLARALVVLVGTAGTVVAQSTPRVGAPSGSGTIPVVVSSPLTSGAGNVVMNGDFELHTGPVCNSNVADAALGTFVSDATGFGVASEVDVYSLVCYGLPAHSGTTKLALHALPNGTDGDAFSMALALPLAGGDACELGFWTHAVTAVDPGIGTLEVGLSNVADQFGTLVASSTNTAPLVWERFTASFSAPGPARYVTFRAKNGPAWIHLDEVTLAVNPATTFCHGDGALTACPCGNDAPPGPTGCLNSLGTGGALGSSGEPSVSSDTLVLVGAGMPNSSALYFQGTQVLGGGAGVAFGDGLRCAGGAIVRLGTKANAAGASAYPGAGDAAIHVRGACNAGDVRRYQVWYRNAASFCTQSTFNLTNGLEVTWTS